MPKAGAVFWQEQENASFGVFPELFTDFLMSQVARMVEQHYTVKQVAALAGIEASTVWRRIRRGEIRPIVKLGHRTVRVPATAVNRWLKGCTQ